MTAPAFRVDIDKYAEPLRGTISGGTVMNLAREDVEHAQFRATAGSTQGFGATPREALDSLMARLNDAPETPIVIWPFNRGDSFFTDAQQQRSRDLQGRKGTLTSEEQAELEQCVALRRPGQ